MAACADQDPHLGSSLHLFTLFDSSTGISQESSHQIPQDLGLKIERTVTYPGKAILKIGQVPYFNYQIVETTDPKEQEFPQEPHAGAGKG